MSVSKDLTVTVTNETEGVTLVMKTLSALGKTKVSISGDPSVYDIKEIKQALKEIEEFAGNNVKEEAQVSKVTEGYNDYLGVS